MIDRYDTMSIVAGCALQDALLARDVLLPVHTRAQQRKLIRVQGRTKPLHGLGTGMAGAADRGDVVSVGHPAKAGLFAHRLFHILQLRIPAVAISTGDPFLMVNVTLEELCNRILQKFVAFHALIGRLRSSRDRDKKRRNRYDRWNKENAHQKSHPSMVKTTMYTTANSPM